MANLASEQCFWHRPGKQWQEKANKLGLYTIPTYTIPTHQGQIHLLGNCLPASINLNTSCAIYQSAQSIQCFGHADYSLVAGVLYMPLA